MKHSTKRPGMSEGVALVLAGGVLALCGLGCPAGENGIPCGTSAMVGCGGADPGTISSSSGASGSGGGSSSGASSSGGGGDAGHVNCDPLAGPLSASCSATGIFVRTVDPDGGVGDGTKDDPYSSLEVALQSATAGRNTIYVCGPSVQADSGLTISKSLVIYGALNCVNLDWQYSGGVAKTALKAQPDVVPLTVQGIGVDVKLYGFSVHAQDATPGSPFNPSGSSIAVIVSAAKATFVDCEISSGAALSGADGMSGTQLAPAGGGTSGGDAMPTGVGLKGTGATNNMCGLAGGDGGNGGILPTGNGAPGLPGDNGSGGLLGAGDTGAGCGGGQKFSSVAVNGSHGLGGSKIGSIDVSGYHGADGGDGKNGEDGRSGGGGGGTRAVNGVHGAGGGGGGAGGCGGARGLAGKAGGSSFALVSIAAMVTLTRCNLSAGPTGNGGNGGDGAYGQPGGNAGTGGKPLMGVFAGCDGGKGGDGGNGGNGGGGAGGHSAGVAFTAAKPIVDVKTTILAMKGGLGGKGGVIVDQNHGVNGLACRFLNFGATAGNECTN